MSNIKGFKVSGTEYGMEVPATNVTGLTAVTGITITDDYTAKTKTFAVDMDSSIASGGTKPVASGTIYTALAGKAGLDGASFSGDVEVGGDFTVEDSVIIESGEGTISGAAAAGELLLQSAQDDPAASITLNNEDEEIDITTTSLEVNSPTIVFHGTKTTESSTRNLYIGNAGTTSRAECSVNVTVSGTISGSAVETSAPLSGSTKLITSGAVFSALNPALTTIAISNNTVTLTDVKVGKMYLIEPESNPFTWSSITFNNVTVGGVSKNVKKPYHASSATNIENCLVTVRYINNSYVYITLDALYTV